jgi:hypothetical protein
VLEDEAGAMSGKGKKKLSEKKKRNGVAMRSGSSAS